MNVVLTNNGGGHVERLSGGETVTTVPVTKDCEDVSFTLDGVTDSRVREITILARCGTHSLGRRLDSSG